MRRLVLVVLACGCTAQDVVVAELEGGPGMRPFRTCVGNQDCRVDELCERLGCSDVTGQCAERPVICDDTAAPSCACDGLSYWNDCLRKMAGITAATAGSCDTNAVTCDDGQPCPTASFCARLYPQGACDPSGSGTCWVLPADCPDGGDGQTWKKCPATPPDCADTCDAIRSQATYAAAPTCQ